VSIFRGVPPRAVHLPRFRHSHGSTGCVIIDVVTRGGRLKDRASGIPIGRLFLHRGVPSFVGGPRLWGLSKKIKWLKAGVRKSGVSVVVGVVPQYRNLEGTAAIFLGLKLGCAEKGLP
jgi:hypothetical protein